ncbi:N-6 DNA methylase [Pseudomonas asplenii]|uniref:N-6 DNA methylase n=1 Tax=Pseudomonas asplenii TaxID=53407 RepID=UPI0037CABCA4
MRQPYVSSSDPLGRYYTKDLISDLLISEIKSDPNLVLDLGSGDGSLSRAAMSRWADALYVTVDIDRVLDSSSLVGEQNRIKHRHHQLDALSPHLMRTIGIEPESVDLALCNPPFIKNKWRNGYEEILKRAGLTVSAKAAVHTSAEFIFIAQNLNSLKSQGQLGLIVPDGFVSGEKNISLREAILNEHSIDSVIKLPLSMFVGTEAQAHIITITKNGNPNKPIKLKSFTGFTHDRDEIYIEKSEAIWTLDYDFYSAHSKRTSLTQTLRSLGCQVNRGRTNSKQAREASHPVLHTSQLRPWELSLELSKTTTTNSNEIVVERGDIVLARVGRDLHTRICMIQSGSMPITDCIYRIRAPECVRDQVFKSLTSTGGREMIRARSHGVSARHLPKDYLLDLPIL